MRAEHNHIHVVSVRELKDHVGWFRNFYAAWFAIQEVVFAGNCRIIGYDRLEPGQFLAIGLGLLIEQLAHRILLKLRNMNDQQL